MDSENKQSGSINIYLKYTEEFDDEDVKPSVHNYKWLPNIHLNNNTYYNVEYVQYLRARTVYGGSFGKGINRFIWTI